MTSQQPRPKAKTSSQCTWQIAQGTHVFEISGYSMHKGLGTGKFIQSATFCVGGYEWCIRYYPDGAGEDSKDYVAVYLELVSKKAKARACYDIRLIDQTTKSSESIFRRRVPKFFNTMDVSRETNAWGTGKFKKSSELEASAYLQDDCLVIEFDVTVIKELMLVETAVINLFQVPSPNLSQDLGNLLETEEEADVTFKVEGEVFKAHALVLAMRSPVFKAELYGPLRVPREQHITIADIQPVVFRALLHFIYTDSLFPSLADLDGDEKKELVQHLLVAADRYDVQGLKAACENALCESLDVKTVAVMLALGDQHNCEKLKNACIDFMISADRWDAVAASKGFRRLKRSCPSILVDVLDKVIKSRKV